MLIYVPEWVFQLLGTTLLVGGVWALVCIIGYYWFFD